MLEERETGTHCSLKRGDKIQPDKHRQNVSTIDDDGTELGSGEGDFRLRR